MENTNLKKQELLKREITDKNIDKDNFLYYCITQKENGDDLDLWSYEELEESIKKFSESYSASDANKNKQTNQKKKKIIKQEIDEDDNLTVQDADDQSEKYAVNKLNLKINSGS